MGLDAAKSLADISYWSEDTKTWETGITSERVKYFVCIPETPRPHGYEHNVTQWENRKQEG